MSCLAHHAESLVDYHAPLLNNCNVVYDTVKALLSHTPLWMLEGMTY